MKRLQGSERCFVTLFTNWVNSLTLDELMVISGEFVNAGGFNDVAEYMFPIAMVELADEELANDFDPSSPFFTRVGVNDDVAHSYTTTEAKAMLTAMLVDNVDAVIEDTRLNDCCRELLPIWVSEVLDDE